MNLIKRFTTNLNKHYNRNTTNGIDTMMRVVNYANRHNTTLDEAITGYHHYATTTVNRFSIVLKLYTVFTLVTVIIAVVDTFIL